MIYTHGKAAFIMLTTRVPENDNSQVLCIPQEMRTDKRDYYINKIGDIYIALGAAARSAGTGKGLPVIAFLFLYWYS